MGDDGAGAKNPAHVIAANGKEAGQVIAGSSIALAPGEYRFVLPDIVRAGRSSRTGCRSRLGATSYRDDRERRGAAGQRQGQDWQRSRFRRDRPPPTCSHTKVASFISGDKYLFAPSQVDVHVDAPPQGYDWHAVPLAPGHRAAADARRSFEGRIAGAAGDVENFDRQFDAEGNSARGHADQSCRERAGQRASLQTRAGCTTTITWKIGRARASRSRPRWESISNPVQRWNGLTRWTQNEIRKRDWRARRPALQRLDGKRTSKRNQAAAQTEEDEAAGEDAGVEEEGAEEEIKRKD